MRPVSSECLPERLYSRPMRFAQVRGFVLSLRAKILVFGLVCVLLPLMAVGAYLLDQNERVLGDKAREGLASAVTRRAEASSPGARRAR